MDSLLGQTISHYRILAPLGGQEGAYVGKDTQSGRPVFIRFFPKGWGGPESLGKLRQLARAAWPSKTISPPNNSATIPKVT